MKHEYKKPELTIHKFETNDVISTSCTCLDNQYHLYNGYFCDKNNNQKDSSPNYYYKTNGCVCPEHNILFDYDPSTPA